MQFYIKPVKRLGLEQCLIFAVSNGVIVWQCQRWSERQARTEALKYATKCRALKAQFSK